MKKLIILGSSRSDGHTRQVVDLFREHVECDLIDLKTKHIAPYDYEFANQDDDFKPLIKDIVARYDLLIFATPEYWYSMSGIMKNFFDRLSDCLDAYKETGRKLRGKKMAVICCSSGQQETEGFDMPFKNSADYLGMDYRGMVHTWKADNEPIEQKVIDRLQQFAIDLNH